MLFLQQLIFFICTLCLTLSPLHFLKKSWQWYSEWKSLKSHWGSKQKVAESCGVLNIICPCLTPFFLNYNEWLGQKRNSKATFSSGILSSLFYLFYGYFILKFSSTLSFVIDIFELQKHTDTHTYTKLKSLC